MTTHEAIPEVIAIKLQFTRDPTTRYSGDCVDRPREVRLRQALKFLLRTCGLRNLGWVEASKIPGGDAAPQRPLPAMPPDLPRDHKRFRHQGE